MVVSRQGFEDFILEVKQWYLAKHIKPAIYQMSLSQKVIIHSIIQTHSFRSLLEEEFYTRL